MVRVGNQYALKPILRGLTLLDSAEREVSNSKVHSKKSNKTKYQKATTKRNTDSVSRALMPARFKLKRKVGYEDDEDSIQEEGTLRGLARLYVDKDVSMDKSP
jgi:hypothetical protein